MNHHHGDVHHVNDEDEDDDGGGDHYVSVLQLVNEGIYITSYQNNIHFNKKYIFSSNNNFFSFISIGNIQEEIKLLQYKVGFLLNKDAEGVLLEDCFSTHSELRDFVIYALNRRYSFILLNK